MNRNFNPEELDIKEKVVAINRVTKVVKGGRNFRFKMCIRDST